MPPLAPNANKLSASNVIRVTQDKAATNEHYIAALELSRVFENSKKAGNQGEVAKAFLFKLESDLLARSDEITVKRLHYFLPKEYFEAICPRFMDLPKDPRALLLRWKVGNTKAAPYSCLELLDPKKICLPWTTVHTRGDNYTTCGKGFNDYTALVRHLATMHVVLFLSFTCPWCSFCGFEKVKVTRHVASCRAMPKRVADMVDAVELYASPANIMTLVKAASKDLKKIRENDQKHGLKRRITLAMTRSEALYRKYAESVKQGEKERWPKKVKPNTPGYPYEDDYTDIFSVKFSKFPFFVTCDDCSTIMMDTEIASLHHLRNCGLKGFMTYHSQKSLDEGVVSENDRRIFKWKESAEDKIKQVNEGKEVDEIQDFNPTIVCTVDGYGRKSVEKSSRKRAAELLKEVEPVNGYRAKKLVIKDEKEGIRGNVRIVGTEGDQVKIKKELTKRVLNLSSFDRSVKKRKLSLDIESNLKKKCARKTSALDLLLDPYVEHCEAVVARLEVQIETIS